ncbi:hypothetical protein [Peptostreptococcus faecalis]|uniref:hypothetical protein n=1 Tax=Peptostreptococcus faecalis TaxID=2045015 RepID=UPI000C7C372C|nr:hypothetical protein [Peptostreptococcus faecalis]
MFKINKVFKKIFFINLLYANPMATRQLQQSEKYKGNQSALYKALFYKSYMLGMILVLGLYSLFLFPIPFDKAPFMLDYMLAFFIVMAVFQTFTIYFNIFYESKDAQWYMPLPINEKTVYTAKLAVVSFVAMQLVVPIVPLITIFFFKNGYGAISLLYGIVDFLICTILVVVVNMILLNILSKVAVLSKFKTSIMTVINTVVLVLNIGVILWLQNFASDFVEKMVGGGDPKYGLLSSIFLSNIGHILLMVGILLVSLLLYKLITGRLEGHFYRYINLIQKSGGTTNNIKKEEANDKKQGKAPKNKGSKIKNTFLKYNFKLISDHNVITQSMLMPLLFPAIMVFSASRGSDGGEFMEIIAQNNLLVGVAIGFFIAILLSFGATGLPSIMISLDGKNYDYIKSLPMDRKSYFLKKLKFSVVVSSILPVLLLLGALIYLGVDVMSIVISIVIYLTTYFFISSQWLMYDYNNVLTDWQNITEINSRMSKTTTFLIILPAIFVVVFLLTMIIVLAEAIGAIPMIVGILVLFLLLCLICSFRLRRFFKKISK